MMLAQVFVGRVGLVGSVGLVGLVGQVGGVGCVGRGRLVLVGVSLYYYLGNLAYFAQEFVGKSGDWHHFCCNDCH